MFSKFLIVLFFFSSVCFAQISSTYLVRISSLAEPTTGSDYVTIKTTPKTLTGQPILNLQEKLLPNTNYFLLTMSSQTAIENDSIEAMLSNGSLTLLYQTEILSISNEQRGGSETVVIKTDFAPLPDDAALDWKVAKSTK